MECEALRYVRDEMGLTNVKLMIPFVRTVTEAKGVIDLLAENGLRRGENDLQVVMMCELPSNAVCAGDFLEHFDGFSIGSNDMTQLTLGLDRDSALVSAGFDERDPAVLHMLSLAITACRERGKYVGICGQGPSDHPDLAEWLVGQGIESMSWPGHGRRHLAGTVQTGITGVTLQQRRSPGHGGEQTRTRRRSAATSRWSCSGSCDDGRGRGTARLVLFPAPPPARLRSRPGGVTAPNPVLGTRGCRRLV